MLIRITNRVSKRFAGIASLSVMLAACGSSNKSTGTDSTARPDVDSSEGPGENLKGCTSCSDFVIDRLVLPANADLWNQLSRDISGDGKPDNALGEFVYQLLALDKQSDLQKDLDSAVNKGDALVLMRLKSDKGGLTSGAQLKGQLWAGVSEKCCTRTDDASACAAEAAQGCFSGNHTFKPDFEQASALATGTVTGDKFMLAAETLTIRIGIFGAPAALTVRGAQIDAKIAGERIIDGKLTGAIDKNELQSSIMTRLAERLNGMLADPNASPAVKGLLALVDTNRDGVISLNELASNSLLKGVVDGDVDINNDGSKEVSVGFGVSAVKAKIDG